MWRFVVVLWALIILLSGWTAITHWSTDRTAAWTSILIILLVLGGVAFLWNKLKT